MKLTKEQIAVLKDEALQKLHAELVLSQTKPVLARLHAYGIARTFLTRIGHGDLAAKLSEFPDIY